MPINPRGRSGLGGKGILPHWGPNHIIVLALTRSGTSTRDLQVAVLSRDQASCLPWVRLSCFVFSTYYRLVMPMLAAVPFNSFS